MSDEVLVLRSTFSIDTSIPCPHGKGTIDECGNREEGERYPYCALSISCPQVVVNRSAAPASEELKQH
jgi:hypothetical protein